MDALSELKSIPHWVAWRYEDRGGPKPTKPLITHTGEPGKSNDPRTWGTFQQAEMRRKKINCRASGLFFQRTTPSPATTWTSAAIPRPARSSHGLKEDTNFRETYAEVSPSGTGIRLIARGKIGAAVKCDPARVEMYADGRYLTITGQHIEETPKTINPATQTRRACQERAKRHGETWAALRRAGNNLEFKRESLFVKQRLRPHQSRAALSIELVVPPTTSHRFFPTETKTPFGPI